MISFFQSAEERGPSLRKGRSLRERRKESARFMTFRIQAFIVAEPLPTLEVLDALEFWAVICMQRRNEAAQPSLEGGTYSCPVLAL